MNKYSRIIKILQGNIIHMMSANIINKIIAMLCNVIITRVLSQSDYGLWSYSLNIYSYLNLITGFGLIAGAFQFGTESKGKNEQYSYFKYCLIKGSLIDLFLVIIFGIFSIIYSFSLPGSALIIRVYMPILIIEYVIILAENLLRCEERVHQYANILNLHSLFIAIGTCIGSLGGIYGVIIGKYLANIITLILICGFLKKEIQLIFSAKQLTKNSIKALWNHSLFTNLSSTLNSLLYLLDVSMIARLIRNSNDIAQYKVATLIPNALICIPASVVICILPTVITNQSNLKVLIPYLKKWYKYLLILNLFASAILFIFAPQIIFIFFSKKYLQAVPIFRILILGYLISGTFRTLSVNILASLHKVKINLLISFVSIICDITFNYTMITEFQVIGAAYATFAVEVITSIISFLFLTVYLKKQYYKTLNNRGSKYE